MILRAKQICLGLVILFMGMSAFLIWPRLQYQSGMAALQTGRYGKAVGYFSRSLSWLSLPVISLGTGLDRFRVSLELGKTQYLQAVGQWREQGLTPEVLDLLKKAQKHLGTAFECEPEDYNASYWLAQAEAAMETGFSKMHPGRANPHDASGYFKKAMALRPAGISVRFLYARYLYRKGRISAIPALVKEMAEVSPSSYRDMRNERFFNQVYYDDVEAGLLLALEKRFVRQDAWKALSRLYWDMGKLDKAGESFAHYRAEKEEISGEDLVHLGSLMIAAGEKEEGFAWFDKAIGDPDGSDAAADAIYDALDKAGQFDVFLEYSFHARDEGLVSNSLDLNAARGMIKQGLLPFARARLVQVNARKESPEAYAMLAWISEQEQDWEQAADMARNGLKLAPGDAKLHYLLSKAHEGAGALDLSRQAAAKAVQLNPGNRDYKRQEQKFVPREIRFNPYNSLLLVIVMAVLILVPLARGGVHLWAKSVIGLLSSGALAVMIVKGMREDVPVFPRTALTPGIWALLLLLGMSALLSDRSAVSVESLVLFFCYVVLFHAAVIVTNSRRFERGVVNVIVGCGFFVAIVGLLKWAGANPFFWWEYPEMTGYKEDFATGIFVNSHHFAGFLGMVLPLVITFFITARRQLEQKFILWSIIAVMVAALALSISTGGWAAAMGGLMFLFFNLAFGRRFNRKRTVLTVLICAIVVVGGLLSATPAVDMVTEKTGKYPLESLEARKRIWAGTVKIIESHWVTGTGPGTFASVYPRFQVPGIPVLSRQAHSDVLEFISETGLLCVPIVLFLLVRFFYYGFRAMGSSSRQRRGIQLGAMAGVVVMLLFSFYHFNLYVPANAVYFSVFAGLGTEMME